MIFRAAIRTKFEAHNRRANEIISRMRANVDVVHAAATKAKQSLEWNLKVRILCVCVFFFF